MKLCRERFFRKEGISDRSETVLKSVKKNLNYHEPVNAISIAVHSEVPNCVMKLNITSDTLVDFTD